MQDNFLVLRTHQVIDDVRGRGITAGVAKPLGTDEALYNGSRVVYSAVAIINWSEGFTGNERDVRTSMRVPGGQLDSLP
jgi:hypothetical protein